MNRKLMPYYLSRTAISIAFGFLLFITGSTVLNSVLIGSLLLALFLWAPHSGRYAVHPEFGVTALRRDEHTQAINDQAARNAFVASMLILGAIVIVSGTLGAGSVSTGLLKLVVASGALIYFISDFWLRKSHQ